MKWKIRLLIMLISVLLISAFASPKSEEQLEAMDSGHVISVQLTGGRPGMPHRNYQWNKNDPVVHKITRWISDAKPVQGQIEYGRHGNPMSVRLTLENGKVIDAEPAFNCVSVTLSDGGGMTTCTPVIGEIMIKSGSSKIRAASLEMYEWLTDGYKDEKYRDEPSVSP